MLVDARKTNPRLADDSSMRVTHVQFSIKCKLSQKGISERYNYYMYCFIFARLTNHFNTLSIRYCDYHLVTNIGYCDYLPALVLFPDIINSIAL